MVLEQAFGAAILHAASKYIANLDLSALRLSVFGGHVVLRNVELKLDVVRREFAAELPIKFDRGFVRELRIRIPWLKLHSEPIEVTVDIVELVMSLEDGDGRDNEERRSSEVLRDVRNIRLGLEAEEVEMAKVAASEARAGSTLGDGWVHHLVTKALANAVLRVRNLVIKLTHGQSVATLSVREIELHSASPLWERAFVDLDGATKCLRKLLEIADLTLCLDRRHLDGQVKHFYQPLIDRVKCVLRCEAHLQPSQRGVGAPTVLFDLCCHDLVTSISEGQLLMLGALVEEVIALQNLRRQRAAQAKQAHEALTEQLERWQLGLEQWREAVEAKVAEAQRRAHDAKSAREHPTINSVDPDARDLSRRDGSELAHRDLGRSGESPGLLRRTVKWAWSIFNEDDPGRGETSMSDCASANESTLGSAAFVSEKSMDLTPDDSSPSPLSPSDGRSVRQFQLSLRHVCVLLQFSSIRLNLITRVHDALQIGPDDFVVRGDPAIAHHASPLATNLVSFQFDALLAEVHLRTSPSQRAELVFDVAVFLARLQARQVYSEAYSEARIDCPAKGSHLCVQALKDHYMDRRRAVDLLPHHHALWQVVPSAMQLRFQRPHRTARFSGAAAPSLRLELDVPAVQLVYEHAWACEIVRFCGLVAKQLHHGNLAPAADDHLDAVRSEALLAPPRLLIRRSDSENLEDCLGEVSAYFVGAPGRSADSDSGGDEEKGEAESAASASDSLAGQTLMPPPAFDVAFGALSPRIKASLSADVAAAKAPWALSVRIGLAGLKLYCGSSLSTSQLQRQPRAVVNTTSGRAASPCWGISTRPERLSSAVRGPALTLWLEAASLQMVTAPEWSLQVVSNGVQLGLLRAPPNSASSSAPMRSSVGPDSNSQMASGAKRFCSDHETHDVNGTVPTDWMALSSPATVGLSSHSASKLSLELPPIEITIAADQLALIVGILSTQINHGTTVRTRCSAGAPRARVPRRTRELTSPTGSHLCLRVICMRLRVYLLVPRSSAVSRHGHAYREGSQLVTELQRVSLRLHSPSRLAIYGVHVQWQPHSYAAGSVAARAKTIAQLGRLLSSEELEGMSMHASAASGAGPPASAAELSSPDHHGRGNEAEGKRLPGSWMYSSPSGQGVDFMSQPSSENCAAGGEEEGDGQSARREEEGSPAVRLRWGAEQIGELGTTVSVQLAPLTVRLEEQQLEQGLSFFSGYVCAREAYKVAQECAVTTVSACTQVEVEPVGATPRPKSPAGSWTPWACAERKSNIVDVPLERPTPVTRDASVGDANHSPIAPPIETPAHDTACLRSPSITESSLCGNVQKQEEGTPCPDILPFPELDCSDLSVFACQTRAMSADEEQCEQQAKAVSHFAGFDTNAPFPGELGDDATDSKAKCPPDGTARLPIGSSPPFQADDDVYHARACVGALPANPSNHECFSTNDTQHCHGPAYESVGAKPCQGSHPVTSSGRVTWQFRLSQLTVHLLTHQSSEPTSADYGALHSSGSNPACGMELRLSMLTLKVTPTALSMALNPLFSSARHTQLRVATISVILLRSPASTLETIDALRDKLVWNRLPLFAPTKLSCSLEVHRWHKAESHGRAAEGFGSATCCFLEVDASHLFLSFSPQHLQVLRSLCRAYSKLNLSAALRPQSTMHIVKQQIQPALPSSPENIERDHSRTSGESVAPGSLDEMCELQQQCTVKETPGGCAGVQQVAHSAAGGSVVWLTWRYAVPHVVHRLVVDTRLSARSNRSAPRAVWGAHCELRLWDVISESWVIPAAGPLRQVDGGWKLDLTDPRQHMGAWEWQLRVLPANGIAAPMPSGSWLLQCVRLHSSVRRADIPRLIVRVASVNLRLALRADPVHGSSPRLHEGELVVFSGSRVQQRLALYQSRGWKACTELKLSIDVLDLDDLTLEPLLSQAKIRLSIIRILNPMEQADGPGPVPLRQQRQFHLDCPTVSLHLGPAAIRLGCAWLGSGTRLLSQRGITSARTTSTWLRDRTPPPRRVAPRRYSPNTTAPVNRAMPIGELIHYANKVVNLTPLELVFSQVGGPPSQMQPLPAFSEVCHSWRLLTSPAKGAAPIPPSMGGGGKLSRCMRFRLEDDWHWSEPVEWRHQGPAWLAVGPPDNYMLLRIKMEEHGMQRILTLKTSHTVANRLPESLQIQLESNSNRRASRHDLPATAVYTAGSLTTDASQQLPAWRVVGGAAVPLLLSFSRSALRSHTINVQRQPITHAFADGDIVAGVVSPDEGLASRGFRLPSTSLQVPLPPLVANRRHRAHILSEGNEVEQLISLGPEANRLGGTPDLFCWFSTYSDNVGSGTTLMFSPVIRLLNTSVSSHLTYRVESGKGHTLAAGCMLPGLDAPLMLCPAADEKLQIWLQLEGYTWCHPPLALDRSDIQMSRGTSRRVEVRMQGDMGQLLLLYLNVERCELSEGAELKVDLLAPFEVVNLCERELILNCSLDLGLCLQLPASSTRQAVSTIGSWGPSHDPSDYDHKYMLRLAIAPENMDASSFIDSGLPQWSRFVAVDESTKIVIPFDDGDEVLYIHFSSTRRLQCGTYHRELVIRPALELSSSTSFPLRVNVCGFSFYHYLPSQTVAASAASVPVERWMSLSPRLGSEEYPIFKPWLAVRVSADLECDNAGSGDDDPQGHAEAETDKAWQCGVEFTAFEDISGCSNDNGKLMEKSQKATLWQWSDEVELGDSGLGMRQRFLLQSDHGDLRLLVCEMIMGRSGVFHAHFFEDPHPPVRVVNYTPRTLYFWGWPVGLSGCDGENCDGCTRCAAAEVRTLGPGLSGQCFFNGCREGGDACVALGTQPNRSALWARGFRLAPPRALHLQARAPRMEFDADSQSTLNGVHVAISQSGPTTTMLVIPAFPTPSTLSNLSEPAQAEGGVSLKFEFGRISLCLWETRDVRRACTLAGSADRKHAPLLHLFIDRLVCDAYSTPKPSAVQADPLWHSRGHDSSIYSGQLLSLHATAHTLQCDSWHPVGGAGVILSVDSGLSSSSSSTNVTTVARFSIILCRLGTSNSSFVRLLEIQLQPLALNVDDMLLDRGKSFVEAVAKCYTRASMDPQESTPSNGNRQQTGTRQSSSKSDHTQPGLLQTRWSGLPRRSMPILAPWLFIEHLRFGRLDVTLTVGTAQLAPIHLRTHRTPLHFEPLSLSLLHGPRASLLTSIASHYASVALSHSAALIGSLQLLGNPTWLIRSITAGLSDALSMPLRGLSEGPRQFVHGLGAGASSFFLHLSNGALTSVAGFTGALAANLGVKPEVTPRDSQLSTVSSAHASLLQSRSRLSRIGIGTCVDGGQLPDGYGAGPLRSTTSQLLHGARQTLLSAVRRPVGGALLLVSEASQSLIHSVSAAPISHVPLPLGTEGADGLVPSAELFKLKVLPQHEAYRCHVLAMAMTPLRGATQHILLLSNSALYIFLPEHTVPLLTLPMHQVERLEGAPSCTAELPNDGTSMLTIFLYSGEAQRLAIPSCVQYSLAADALHLLTAMHEQNQLALAASLIQDPSWLYELRPIQII